MSNRLSSEDLSVRARRSRAWLLPCLAIGVLVPTLVYAQPVAMQAKSALYWVLGGQTLIVTVAEVGDTDEGSLVAIEIRDAANVVKASTPPRNLALGKPVILSAQVPAATRQQLRAIVTVTIPFSPEVHQPSVSMEVFDPTSLTIKTLPPCAVPIDQMPSAGGGAEGTCGGGWHLTSPTPGAD
jgi:hypothetical protein